MSKISKPYLEDEVLKQTVINWLCQEPTAEEPYDEWWIEDYIYMRAADVETQVKERAERLPDISFDAIREALLETSGDTQAAADYIIVWIKGD